MIFQLSKNGKTADYDPNLGPDTAWEAIRKVAEPEEGVFAFNVLKGETDFGEFQVDEADVSAIGHGLELSLCNKSGLDIYAEDEDA